MRCMRFVCRSRYGQLLEVVLASILDDHTPLVSCANQSALSFGYNRIVAPQDRATMAQVQQVQQV